ncbi:hypothetical protein NEOKW01_1559 [Nematocida sp. AWRm80]|nr:hypothetical protein NEOKW01_1559 [Nematocida sp. AWRm80]
MNYIDSITTRNTANLIIERIGSNANTIINEIINKNTYLISYNYLNTEYKIDKDKVLSLLETRVPLEEIFSQVPPETETLIIDGITNKDTITIPTNKYNVFVVNRSVKRIDYNMLYKYSTIIDISILKSNIEYSNRMRIYNRERSLEVNLLYKDIEPIKYTVIEE